MISPSIVPTIARPVSRSPLFRAGDTCLQSKSRQAWRRAAVALSSLGNNKDRNTLLGAVNEPAAPVVEHRRWRVA